MGTNHCMGAQLFFVFEQILATARRNRITFGTQMNQHSSRSHALLCITVQGTDLATGSKTTGQSAGFTETFLLVPDLVFPLLLHASWGQSISPNAESREKTESESSMRKQKRPLIRIQSSSNPSIHSLLRTLFSFLRQAEPGGPGRLREGL